MARFTNAQPAVMPPTELLNAKSRMIPAASDEPDHKASRRRCAFSSRATTSTASVHQANLVLRQPFLRHIAVEAAAEVLVARGAHLPDLHQQAILVAIHA